MVIQADTTKQAALSGLFGSAHVIDILRVCCDGISGTIDDVSVQPGANGVCDRTSCIEQKMV